MPSGAEETVSDYSSFIEAVKPNLAVPEYSSTKHFQQGEVRLNLGSIHSVKGKSVDGILVVESEVWEGSSKDQNCMDLTTVLPHAFGIVDEKFTGAALTAATNVFVGVTRARELLGLAMRKSTAEQVVDAAKAQGWKVVDLVAAAGFAADD